MTSSARGNWPQATLNLDQESLVAGMERHRLWQTALCMFTLFLLLSGGCRSGGRRSHANTPGARPAISQPTAPAPIVFPPAERPMETTSHSEPASEVQPAAYFSETNEPAATSAESDDHRPAPASAELTQTAPQPQQAQPKNLANPQRQAPNFRSPSDFLDAASRGFNQSQWRPPGIVGPWPRDEYLCDGGDRIPQAGIDISDRVVGLSSEETVVHFQTRNGQGQVQASNQVCIYAPRFAAVRRIYGTVHVDQHQRVAGMGGREQFNRINDSTAANTFVQPLQPGRQMGTKSASRLLAQNRVVPLTNADAVAETASQWLPFEDFNVIRRGVMDNSEKARLTNQIQSAQSWSGPLSVQIVIDGKLPAEASGNAHTEETIGYELRDGKRRMRIIKVASHQDAQPGEEVSFTLRIDNVGDLPIDRATVLDHLTTRLEYVDQSQECSVDHRFSTQPSTNGSDTLRWELDQTLKVGEGTIIRFRCLVR